MDNDINKYTQEEDNERIKPGYDARLEFNKELKEILRSWRISRMEEDFNSSLKSLSILVAVSQMGLSDESGQKLYKEFEKVEEAYYLFEDKQDLSLFKIFRKKLNKLEFEIFRKTKHLFLPFNGDDEDNEYEFNR